MTTPEENNSPSLDETRREVEAIRSDLELLTVRMRKLADRFPACALRLSLHNIVATFQHATLQTNVLDYGKQT